MTERDVKRFESPNSVPRPSTRLSRGNPCSLKTRSSKLNTLALEVTGVIENILPLEKGQTKDGKEWKKQSFLLKTDEQYSNLYCFEIFGDEKVENFIKFNKVGQSVKVDFNVGCNEWNGKYFTKLQAWKIFKADSKEEVVTQEEIESDILPF